MECRGECHRYRAIDRVASDLFVAPFYCKRGCSREYPNGAVGQAEHRERNAGEGEMVVERDAQQSRQHNLVGDRCQRDR